MLKKYFIIIALVWSFIQLNIAFAEPSGKKIGTPNLQLLVAPDMGKASIINAIDQATDSIDLAMYLFTDKKIAAALKKAAERGVHVHVLMERAPYTFEQDNHGLMIYWHGSKVQQHSAPARSSGLNFLHEKLMIIDHRQAWIMTFNFTHSSFSKNTIERNFVLLDQQAFDVQKLETLFEKDWLEQPITAAVLEPHTTIVLSPINTQQQLIHLIAAAHSQIKIYADGLDDYVFMQALANATGRGVHVQILHTGPLHDSTQAYLIQHGVTCRAAQGFKNHAKALLIDQQAFYVGSSNFTHNAFMHNRELGMIVSDKCLATQLAQQFDKDWSGHSEM